MGIQQNVAKMMRAFKTAEDKSMTEFSEELEISRSTLQSYLNGTGNPSVSMLDHIAGKLDVDPLVLVSDVCANDPADVILLMMRTMNMVDMLSQTKRRALAELFLRIVSLWEEPR